MEEINWSAQNMLPKAFRTDGPPTTHGFRNIFVRALVFLQTGWRRRPENLMRMPNKCFASEKLLQLLLRDCKDKGIAFTPRKFQIARWRKLSFHDSSATVGVKQSGANTLGRALLNHRAQQ